MWQHILETIKIFILFHPELVLLGIYTNEIIQKERKIIYISTLTTVPSNIIEEKIEDLDYPTT